jgi:hypothetical protein
MEDAGAAPVRRKLLRGGYDIASCAPYCGMFQISNDENMALNGKLFITGLLQREVVSHIDVHAMRDRFVLLLIHSVSVIMGIFMSWFLRWSCGICATRTCVI